MPRKARISTPAGTPRCGRCIRRWPLATPSRPTPAGNDAATVTAHGFEAVEQAAPTSVAFSSQGPAIAGGGDLLKPDITAPGDEILAGYMPSANPDGGHFGIMGGTSMASPHIAGLAALIKSANPDWSPMAIKSAIMTTAYQTDTEGEPIGREGSDAAATPFQTGAGHVDGQAMFDPGLVYDSDATDWIRYGCAIGQFQEVAPADTCEPPRPTTARSTRAI